MKNKSMQIISPLFTLFIYKHSPEKYEELQTKHRARIIKGWGYNRDVKEFYTKNKSEAESLIRMSMEFKYPPYAYNDVAGFLSIYIENATEGIRIVPYLFLYKRMNKKIIFINNNIGTRKNVRRHLLTKPKTFSRQFYKKIEEIIEEIKTSDIFKKKKYYFAFKDCRLNWDLMKTISITKFIKELGTDWVY